MATATKRKASTPKGMKKPTARKGARPPAKSASPKPPKAAASPPPEPKPAPVPHDAIEAPDRSAPALAEVDHEVLEFIAAIDRFKKQHGRPFPSWSEVLLVLRELGYHRG